MPPKTKKASPKKGPAAPAKQTQKQEKTKKPEQQTPTPAETKPEAKSKKSVPATAKSNEKKNTNNSDNATNNKKRKLEETTAKPEKQKDDKKAVQKKQKESEDKVAEPAAKKQKTNVAQPKIEIASGFAWDSVQFSAPEKEKKEESSDEEEEDDEATTKKPAKKEEDDEDDDDTNEEDKVSKKQSQLIKKRDAKLTEQIIAERERELLSNVLPETEEDFERLLVGSPNSSYLWIQYMAYKLGLTDIDGARKIGERALQTVSVREEQEKFNIHAALMNLEAKFGTEATQKSVFDRARQYCEPKPVYLQQCKIYEMNGDAEAAEEMYKKTVRKFNKSKKCWEAWEIFEMKRSNLKKANEILERSLLSLPKHKHLKAISRFAALHYKHGSIIQGNKLFEGIVQSHPNRTDMWSMFLDVEIGAKRVDVARTLFERVVHLKLSTKKMKTFLQRYLKFETDYGSEENQERVKQIARDYIKSKTGQ